MKRIIKPAHAALNDVTNAVSDTAELLKRSGRLAPGYGVASGVFAFSLAVLCFLGVLAFHFPQYLTTPQLRAQYDPDIIRAIMFACMVLAGSISLLNVVFKRWRSVNGVAAGLIVLTLALGGSHVPVADFPDHTPYIGLDWFISTCSVPRWFSP